MQLRFLEPKNTSYRHWKTEKSKFYRFCKIPLHYWKNPKHCLNEIWFYSQLLSYETGFILAFAWNGRSITLFLIKFKLDEITLKEPKDKVGKKKINFWPRDVLSASVKDLLNAPAAEEEIQALLHRLDETVGKVSTQEVLSSSQTHSHVPKMLSQGGGGHGLGERTLGMHCSTRRSDQIWPVVQLESALCPAAQQPPLFITSYRNRTMPPFMSCFFSTVLCFKTCAD